MDSFAAFLPIDRRYALATGQSLPDRVTGAALFADISGFTPLTAVLAEELGPQRGAEELSKHLNHVFTNLITEVHHYGGSVIAFSGDAITCWFNNHAQVDETPTDRALACALTMQQVMSRLTKAITPTGTTISLALKIAIATGPARRFLVGDPDIQAIEVLAGTTLDHMAIAESVANKGEIILTAQSFKSLNAPPTIKEMRTSPQGHQLFIVDNASPTTASPISLVPPAIAADSAKHWLLPPIYAFLESGHSEFLAELRSTIALFIKFSGIDYDQDDEAGEKLDRFVRDTQAILQRYDGHLLQITMGDKGSYFYITFGAPVSHEDDPYRAVSASLDLQNLAARLSFIDPIQIGINQGMAFSGAYGSPTRRTYGVIGNHVNISARLMVNAEPGQTLVAQSIMTAVNTQFDFSALPPVKLKGVRDPFPLWSLSGRHQSSASSLLGQTDATMIGREAELAAIQEQLTQLANGRSSTLLIEGEAGIGKSRLIREVLRQPDTSSIGVFIGSGSAIEQNTLYRAWQPVFEKIFNLPAHTSETISTSLEQQQIFDLLTLENQQLVPLLNPVLPLDLPDNEFTAQMSGELRQEKTLDLLIEVLQTAVANRPFMFIIEDGHWLDSASWMLIRRVHAQLQPILLIIAARPFTGAVPPVYSELSEQTQTTLIQLNMLPPTAIDTLICQRLDIQFLPKPVSDLIHAKAEGHPFFSEELAYSLRDAGLISIQDGACKLETDITTFNTLDFPDTIQGVIISRIDQLAPIQQLTLKVASVIGRVFTYKILHNIYPTGQQTVDLLQELAILDNLDITFLETPEPNLAYTFKHIVTQEVAYSLMTFAQRQQLHQKTAVWYETTHENDPRYYPLLAYHWLQADESNKASHYYGQAGENAFHNYANQEAIRFLTKALALENDASPFLKASWERQIGEAAYRLTLMEQSETHYKAAMNLMGKPLPQTTPNRILQIIGQLVRQGFHRLFSKRFVAQASSEVEKTTLLETARAYEGISEIYYNNGDFLTTFLCVMTAFNLAEKAGPSPELVRGYANMCATLGTISLDKSAQNYRTRALAMADQIDDLPAQAWSRIPLSSYSLQSGAWDRGTAEIEEALDIYTRLGDWRKWCIAAWTLPQISQGQGKLTLANQQWRELYDVALRSQDTRHQVRAKGGQFFNHLSLGQTQKAYDCLAIVSSVLDEHPEMMPVEERLWFGMIAKKALAEEKWQKARELAHAQMAAISRAPLKFDLLDVFAASAEVMLILWERDFATQKEAQHGIKTFKGYARSYPFARPRFIRLQARYAWLSGQTGKAQKLWQKSLAQANALNMPYEKALSLQCMARYLKNDDYQSQADTLFSHMEPRISNYEDQE